MSEYTFAPDVSLSTRGKKSSIPVTPNKQPRTPRSLLLLNKTRGTGNNPVFSDAKQLPPPVTNKLQSSKKSPVDRSSSRIAGMSKPVIEHETSHMFSHADNIPAEVFVSITSHSNVPFVHEEDAQVNITAETSSESISRAPDLKSHADDSDCGSI